MTQRGKKRKAYTVKKKKVVFSKGPIHLVDLDIKMADGSVVSRQILEHPGAAVIIPKVGKDRYLLIKQFRFAARDYIWEWPAGGVEPKETPRQAAIRELKEEVGMRPKKIKKLISFYPTPGVSEEVMHVFLAEQLVPAFAEKDEDEEIEVHEFSLKQIKAMIRKGEITDAKTILGFCYLIKAV